ncbi:MAG TPA: hypothetical protein VFO85_05750, partial [Vicinamibacteria bacterium]|nr:hypothetical protein [Vicinamibacteria bacterium]
MNARLGARSAVLLAALGGGAAAIALDRLSPPPAADIARGSEEAFARGLHLREIPPGGRPQRWTQAHALFTFGDVPAGPGTVEVAVQGHRAPVAVVFDGVILGQVGVGQ